MAHRIIQQARGHGSLTYRTRKKAFRITVGYPKGAGDAEILKLLDIACYSAPVAKMILNGKVFYNIAASGLHEGQKVNVGAESAGNGDITCLGNLPVGTSVFCIETRAGGGPKLIRSSGLFGRITKKDQKGVYVLMPSKEEKFFSPDNRATVGAIAAAGRLDKPMLKAGKAWHKAKATGGRIYPQTSAVKMNAIDHPFGSGRGKRVKSKIVKRWAPAGKKVGLLRPRKTGRRSK